MTAGRRPRTSAPPPGPGVPAWADFGHRTAASVPSPLRPAPPDWREFGRETEEFDAEDDDKATVADESGPTGLKPATERGPR
jgi:hypothetical protein